MRCGTILNPETFCQPFTQMVGFETVWETFAMADRSCKFICVMLALLLPVLSGCMPPTPETALDWGVTDALSSVGGHGRIIPSKARTYVYRGDNTNGADVTPTQRPVSPQDTPYVHTEPTVLRSMRFEWPVSGRIISRFGSDESGARNDGINIAAKFGEPIHAAASGSVLYVGSELASYGNLILIKHTDGYVTAYAHAERILVDLGDPITKGQVIGYAGKTGDVTSPQLHFEIRHDAKPVDPRPLLVASH